MPGEAARGEPGYVHLQTGVVMITSMIVQLIGPMRDMQTRSCAKLLLSPEHAKRLDNAWYMSSGIHATDASELKSPRLHV